MVDISFKNLREHSFDHFEAFCKLALGFPVALLGSNHAVGQRCLRIVKCTPGSALVVPSECPIRVFVWLLYRGKV